MENNLVIQDNSSKEYAIRLINNCPTDVKHEVLIRPLQQKRSLSQSRLYWLWLTEVAQQMEVPDEHGELIKLSKEDWHDLCRMKWLGVKVIKLGDKEFPRPSKSTTNLKVGEFAEYLTQIESHFIAKGVQLTFTDDYGLAMGIN